MVALKLGATTEARLLPYNSISSTFPRSSKAVSFEFRPSLNESCDVAAYEKDGARKINSLTPGGDLRDRNRGGGQARYRPF
jgi:hypothetical protein